MEPFKHRADEETSVWLAEIVASCDDAIISKNLDGVFMTWNKAAERIFGYTPEEVIGRPATILIPPERLNEEPYILERIRRGERVDHYETVRVHKNGERIDISLTVSPVKNAAGKIIGASKIARDITDRKRHEERVVILAREAEHRTKNVLASVQALIRLSNAETAPELKRLILERIQALAKVNTTLIETHWSGADIRRLAENELAVFCHGEEKRALITGPSLKLAPETAQVLAMALHELTTNAAKYGALSVPRGRVRVEWSQTAQSLKLNWIESSGPKVIRPSHNGFGTRAMQRLIAGHLNGSMHFHWQPEGLACEIDLPL